GSGQCSGQLKTRHRSDRIDQHDSRMIKKFLKFNRCLAVAAHLGTSETTHVDWIKNSEKGVGESCCTRHSKVVRSSGLRNVDRFRSFTLFESFEGPQRRQIPNWTDVSSGKCCSSA